MGLLLPRFILGRFFLIISHVCWSELSALEIYLLKDFQNVIYLHIYQRVTCFTTFTTIFTVCGLNVFFLFPQVFG